MNTPHINQLREHLMATLESLRDRSNPMEPDRARALAQVGSVLVDTVRVENDYLKITGQDRSAFLEETTGLTRVSGTPTAHQPFPVSVIHRVG